MVMSKTSAVDINTQAVSPEFIFNTSFKIIYCETQILKVKRIKICKSNNPAKGGGYNTQ